MPIALGTAQLGMAYGVANQVGRPDTEAAARIVEIALRSGVRWFDTAQNYGGAEQVLGMALTGHSDDTACIVTKLGADIRLDDADEVLAAVRASAGRLGRQPAAVLLHDSSRLEQWTMGLGRALARCRDESLTAQIGASVYGPDEFARALDLPGLTIIQVAYNVLDRRVETRGLLHTARDRGITVMLRSPFLQGLLVMPRDQRPGWLDFAAERLDAWLDICARHDASPATVALRYVLDRNPAAIAVVGCESAEQLDGILTAAGSPSLDDRLLDELEGLACDDPALVDPTSWPRP